MSHTVLLQPAYVLHSRAYRDTSLLLDLLTPDYGRVNAIARSARGPRSRFKGVLQPFTPLLVSWYGKTDLMSLSTAEINGIAYQLNGEALLCGLYLHELLVRLLHRYDPHAQIYYAYQNALNDLQQGHALQPTLRLFEKRLLLELGYALELDQESTTGEKVDPEKFYYFDPNYGLSCADSNLLTSDSRLFQGRSLLALHADKLTDDQVLRDAKRLLRIALNKLLENKPIKSRELFFK